MNVGKFCSAICQRTWNGLFPNAPLQLKITARMFVATNSKAFFFNVVFLRTVSVKTSVTRDAARFTEGKK